MKKLLFILFGISVIFYFSCSKGIESQPACTNALPYADSATLAKFAGDSINTTFDPSGIFYQIIDSGSNVKANAYSILHVTYIGKLMNNTIFDSATNSNLMGYTPSQLIGGWQFALSKIGVGGRIKILVPSAYAYGCNGRGPIPDNAPLYFDITLLSIN